MKLFFLRIGGLSASGTPRNVSLFAVVAEQPVEIREVADQLGLALFRTGLRPPGVDQRMGLAVVQAAVRAAVESDEQQRPRLFGPHRREHLLNGPEQLFALRLLAEDRVGRQQQCVEFAAHDVAFELQTAVLPHDLGRNAAVFVGDLPAQVVTLGRVEPFEQRAVVQPGVAARIFGIQFDDLVLPGLDREQRDAHPVVDRDDDLLVARGGRCDDPGLDPRKTSLGDTDPVALDQPDGIGSADRNRLGIRAGNPSQVAHGAVREIGVVVGLLAVADPREKVVLWKTLLDAVDLGLRCADEQIVIQQRPPGLDETAVYLSGLDKRRGKVFEKRFAVTLPPGQFPVQFFGHGPPA